ncbi:hypothetical protein INT46_003109 [Mucor plumbeus]|uniref:Uncharacterized protein n=1 Tax=Mucor plumbeus TaxID=97098 RepID=A0A8H7R0N2_9FUNG|nr:hypothetical protein INT46_003109 [Mucor plumbeus]
MKNQEDGKFRSNMMKEEKELTENFYFSNANAKRRRRLELAKNRYYHKLEVQERTFTQSKAPIMFIGDRGHGVRSIIKGHQQFGGHWKEKIHGRYTSYLTDVQHFLL